MYDPEKEERHPSYGVMTLHRVNGTARLFDSDLTHQSFIALRISGASVRRDLAQDWISPDATPIIEVSMSHAQFAEAITTFNNGRGTPVTIKRIPGDWQIPDPPHRGTDETRAREDFADFLGETAEQLRVAVAEAKAIVDSGKPLNKSQSKALLEAATRVGTYFAGNADFVLRRFQEAMDRTVQHSKAEVDAFISGAVTRAGLDALAGAAPRPLDGPTPLPALPPGAPDVLRTDG